MLTKKITLLLLSLMMAAGLGACYETPKTESEPDSADAGGHTEASADTEESMNLQETAEMLDTLAKDERYAWYEDRFGTAFTEHVAVTPYDEKKDIIWFEGYDEIPCDLYALLWYSKLDAIILSTFTGDSETIRNACGIAGEMNGETR